MQKEELEGRLDLDQGVLQPTRSYLYSTAEKQNSVLLATGGWLLEQLNSSWNRQSS